VRKKERPSNGKKYVARGVFLSKDNIPKKKERHPIASCVEAGLIAKPPSKKRMTLVSNANNARIPFVIRVERNISHLSFS
jgi:hypothetical protein